MSFLRLEMLGNLTRDPELRFAASGLAVANFGVAINRKWKGNDGELKEEVYFQNCTAFGKRAQFLGDYAKKGQQIYVEAHLKLEEWDDKQTGNKRSKVVAIVDSCELCGSRREGGGAPAGKSTDSAVQPDPADNSAQPDPNDDVPF